MISEKTTVNDFIETLWARHSSSYSEKENNIFALFRNSLNFCRKFGLPLELAREYLVNVSVKNPTSIKMYKSLENLLKDTSDGEGKATIMKLSKFLIYTNKFTEVEIKGHVEIFNSLVGNFNYYELTVADPDGWVDVYENGINFSSCMVYNRENKLLHSELFGDNHPIRTYCHPNNSIRLVYLANKQWQSGITDFKVTARAIVNYESDDDNDYHKFYYSVYGDQALRSMLDAAGFERVNNILLGQYLIKQPFNDTYIVPYLDGDYDFLQEHNNNWQISESGNYQANSALGLANIVHFCPTCGSAHEEGNFYGLHDEFCTDCVDEYCVYAYTDKYNQEYIYLNNVYYEYDNDYYTPDALEAHDLILIDNEVYHIDDVQMTSRGYVYEENCIELNIPFENQNYAHMEDIIYVWDIDGNKLTVHEDTNLSSNSLFLTKEEYLVNNQIEDIKNE